MGAALAVGCAWFATEIALLATDDVSLDRGELLRRAFALLPWQLALFGLLGLLGAPALAWRGATPRGAAWWTLGAASAVFLGARVGEGLLPQRGALPSTLGMAAVALGVAAVLVLLRAAGRALPRTLRAAWPLAVWTGWTLLFLCFLRRAGPALSNGPTGLTGWLEFVEPGEVALAAGATALVLVAAAGARRLFATGVCLMFLASGGARGVEDGSEAAVRPDVIVLLIDTHRFDHLGANVGRPDLTPNLDAFALDAIRFARAFSPSNVTSLAMPGILASLPAAITPQRIPEEVDTLAERLHAAGYATLGVSANPNVSAQFGYDQGFDVFLGPTDQPDFLIAGVLHVVGVLAPGPAYGAGVVGAALYYPPFEAVRRRGLWLLERSAGPTFLYLHTMDPHGPYLPPREHLPADFSIRDFYPYHRFLGLSQRGVLNSPEFAARLRNLRQRYEGGVRYADAQFGELVRGLRAVGRWDESLVWVLSDHGEAFGERDFAGHGGTNVTRTLLQVPLLLKLPRSWDGAARVEQTPVSALDVIPTTLSLLGEPPPRLLFGRDLSALVREGRAEAGRLVVSSTANYEARTRTVIDTYSAIDWPWKLDLDVVRQGDATGRRLFHLEEDPAESRDRAGREPKVVARLEQAVRAWRDLEEQHLFGPDASPLDPRVREQLRQLGYVQ